jgi:polysaccharide chain length determinant protein (PEP-CTERM system associated)
MTTPSNPGGGLRPKQAAPSPTLPLEHYARLIYHRKWVVLSVFALVAGGTFFFAQSLPNIYQSETVIMVDPQKVPESYVKSTVTGDLRNRLGTLSQQILSATRLQKIIDTLNLYPEERKTLAREDVITKMRSEISPTIVGDFGGSQDLQAFKITYRGKDPRLVAQVTNQLATLFIDENWKAREQQATGTTEFLENQLQDTRKTLEDQENKLKDFRLKHVGEMPEQEAADLTLLGQVQAQLQLEGEAVNRAEDQKNLFASMMSQSAPVVDTDPPEPDPAVKAVTTAQTAPASQQNAQLNLDNARLDVLLRQYTPAHPDVKRLKKKIEDEKARLAANDSAPAAVAVPVPPPPPATETAADTAPASRTAGKRTPPPVAMHFNPILQSQMKAIDFEIAKHKTEQERLSKLVASYRAKVDSIPLREQEIASLTRDYEMNKAHYAQLLDRELSAETATQLEIRQKGEKFEVLDTAQPAERPSSPNRKLINAGGAIAGLTLGLILALATELLGMSITGAQDIIDSSSLKVLGVIPVIETQRDRTMRRRRLVVAGASATFATLLLGAVLFLRYHSRI